MKVENAEKSFLFSLRAQWSGLSMYAPIPSPPFFKELNTSFPYWKISGYKAALASLYLGVSGLQTVGEVLTANPHPEGWCQPLPAFLLVALEISLGSVFAWQLAMELWKVPRN